MSYDSAGNWAEERGELDPETVGIAHAQAETQRQPHPIGRAQSRVISGSALDAIHASNARRTNETADRVRSLGCSCLGCDALLYATYHDSDLVNDALTDAGVA